MTEWGNFFVATAGAAAALTGLIFVAVSISLAKILSFEHLTGRPLGSLILPYVLSGIVLITHGSVGLYWLIPGILFSFIKALVDAWVLLVEIHR